MHSSMDGTLEVQSGPTKHSGINPNLGPYQQIDITWQATNSKQSKIITSFQVYAEVSAIVFTQVRIC